MPLPIVSGPVSGGVKNVIGIASGKGGVGKSTVCIMLARCLKSLGYEVGVLDADLYGPSCRKLLSEGNLPSQGKDSLIPAVSEGIRWISMSHFRDEGHATAVRAPIANSLITQFLENVVWGDLDFLLIDFPPGTGDIQITLNQKGRLNGVLIVTTPQEIALLDVRKAIHLFSQMNVPIKGIIENMSYYQQNAEKISIFGQGGGMRLAQETQSPFLGDIQIDPELCLACDAGINILTSSPSSPSSLDFHKITDHFLSSYFSHLSGVEGGPSCFDFEWKEM